MKIEALTCHQFIVLIYPHGLPLSSHFQSTSFLANKVYCRGLCTVSGHDSDHWMTAAAFWPTKLDARKSRRAEGLWSVAEEATMSTLIAVRAFLRIYEHFFILATISSDLSTNIGFVLRKISMEW